MNTTTEVNETKREPCSRCGGTGNDPHDCGFKCPRCYGKRVEPTPEELEEQKKIPPYFNYFGF